MSEPMTDDEILDLLSATLHGPLPHATMMRVFATLAEVPDLREKAASDFSPIRWSEMLRQKDEALDAATERARALEKERAALRALLGEAGEQVHDMPCGSGSDNQDCLGCRIDAALKGKEGGE